jgi:hypothetical protein
MGTEIATLLASIPAFDESKVKADFKEDVRQDWRVDWDATADSAPANTVAPVITDVNGATLVVGNTVTVAPGTWTGSPAPTYTYEWRRAGVAIPGATAASYVVVVGDVGSAITCAVTGTNLRGSATAVSNSINAV